MTMIRMTITMIMTIMMLTMTQITIEVGLILAPTNGGIWCEWSFHSPHPWSSKQSNWGKHTRQDIFKICLFTTLPFGGLVCIRLKGFKAKYCTNLMLLMICYKTQSRSWLCTWQKNNCICGWHQLIFFSFLFPRLFQYFCIDIIRQDYPIFLQQNNTLGKYFKREILFAL